MNKSLAFVYNVELLHSMSRSRACKFKVRAVVPPESLVSFVRPIELYSFDASHVIRSRPIAKLRFSWGYNTEVLAA